MYLKYPVLDMIQRIHLRCGSFGSMIRFWILGKKWNIHFRIKDPDLDFTKKFAPIETDFFMTLKNGFGKCYLFLLSANEWEDQNMASSLFRKRKPQYGKGIVRLANCVAVWGKSEVSVDSLSQIW